jgi:hypothetical protein
VFAFVAALLGFFFIDSEHGVAIVEGRIHTLLGTDRRWPARLGGVEAYFFIPLAATV